MASQPQRFDPRQEMLHRDFELQYKRDSYLKNVELHHHDFFEIYFLVSGDVTYQIESRIVHVMPGDLLLISPRELHQVRIKPEMSVYERYVLWVAPETVARLSSPKTDLSAGLDPTRPGQGNLLRLKPEDRTATQNLLAAMDQEISSGYYGAELLRESLLTQLLVNVNRLVLQQGACPEEDPRTSRAVAQVVSYISLHYGEALSLDSLAEQFYVSKYHLSHAFQRQMGTSLYRYIQKKRLMISRQLMAQGEKPSEVYAQCGFGDYAGFYRAFKAEYGTSPREFILSTRSRSPE
ncbi:MAG: AraC family transcriptional regulator [Faecousia sp.]